MSYISIIFKYLLRRFVGYFLLCSTIVIIILFLANSFDVLQRFRNIPISPEIFWQLIAWKVPYLFNEVSSLIVFFSTLLFLHYISKSNELIIMLSNGVSIWKIFLVPITAAFIVGAFITGIVSPVGAYGLKQYNKLDLSYSTKPRSNLIVSQSGIFFFENYQNINRIVQARSIHANKKEVNEILLLNVDDKNNLVSRIDAPKSILTAGNFELEEARVITDEGLKHYKQLKIPTNLTINNLIKQFIPPELIPIWELKSTIIKFSNSGLVVTHYKLYYFKQLFKPLITVGMACLACWFISFNMREKSQSKIIFFGSLVGIAAYFILELIPRVLAFGGVNPLYAILLPVIFIIVFSNFVILHFHEA